MKVVLFSQRDRVKMWSVVPRWNVSATFFSIKNVMLKSNIFSTEECLTDVFFLLQCEYNSQFQ